MFNFSSFILLKQDSLEKEFCEEVIKKFEKDDRKYQGGVGDLNQYNPNLKKSMDLHISSFEEWKDEDEIFYKALGEGVKEYAQQDFLTALDKDDTTSNTIELFSRPLHDSGYQIQRTDPGGYYKWHQDWTYRKDLGSRVLTYIWYLNDITEGGGYTDFLDGTRITPKQGTLLLFPATWTYYHRGFPPEKETKYISTGWLYYNRDLESQETNQEKLD